MKENNSPLENLKDEYKILLLRDRIQKEKKMKGYTDLEQSKKLAEILPFDVKNPYEQRIQYSSIEDGIKAYAEVYSFNIESELFNQLTKEQQALWRKEIEQACINGGNAGVELVRDIRYEENKQVQTEMNLEDLFQALPEKIADKKSHQVYELSIYHYDGQCVVDYVGEIDHDSLYTFDGDNLYEAIEKAWNWLSKNSTGG